MTESILIVDDEEPIRRTFSEWLRALPVSVIAVGDAEAALRVANGQSLDLAILDWNLGSGSDGLRLLEDLVEFQPELIAILVTGYAAQATPLDALRKGVRDYLDKNSDLTRESFLASVKKQLAAIVPAKRQRALNVSLAKFRETVEKVLPMVRATATLNDPVPLTRAVRSLMKFALKSIGASDAVLVVHHEGTTRAYDSNAAAIATGDVQFSRSLAATAMSLREPAVIADLSALGNSNPLFPFESNRRSLLAVPMILGTSQVVLELFDKALFTDSDRAAAAVIAEIGSELLQASLAERQTHSMIADAVEAALSASQDVSNAMNGSSPPSDPPPPAVLETLRRGLDASSNAVVDADIGLDLVAAVRELAVRHGPEAVQHCVKTIRSLRTLLDSLGGD